MYCNYVSVGKSLCCPTVCVQSDSHPALAVGYIWTLGINFVATVCRAQMLVVLENFFLLWGSFSWLMWVNYSENVRFLESYFCLSFFFSVMGRTSKLIGISHLHVRFCLSFALPSVKFWVVQLFCSWIHSPSFSVDVLYSQNRLAVFRVCLLVLAFIPFPGCLISVLSEGGVWGRERLSFSMSLHFSVFRLWLPFFPLPSILPACCLSQKNPKTQKTHWITENSALLASAWNTWKKYFLPLEEGKTSGAGGCFSQRWDAVHWEIAASEPGCSFLIAWKDMKWLLKGAEGCRVHLRSTQW